MKASDPTERHQLFLIFNGLVQARVPPRGSHVIFTDRKQKAPTKAAMMEDVVVVLMASSKLLGLSMVNEKGP